MAISFDGGATFSKLGKIVQPYVTRSQIITANTNLSVGGGTLVVADGNGAHIENVAMHEPADVYLYVFYAAIDPSAASSAPCDVNSCIAVARALLSDVISAAFDRNASAFPTLFKKYWQRAFAQPATSSDPNAAVTVIQDTTQRSSRRLGEFPTVLFDSSTQQYLIAYVAGQNAIAMRHGTSLLSWSGPVVSGAIDDGSDSIHNAGGRGLRPVDDGDPWLFYVRDPMWPDWADADVVNRRVQLLLTASD